MGRFPYFTCIAGVFFQNHTHYLYISDIVSGSWLSALRLKHLYTTFAESTVIPFVVRSTDDLIQPSTSIIAATTLDLRKSLLKAMH